MRYYELHEARRNSEHPSQQRSSNIDKLKKYWDASWLKSKYGSYPENVYISFTSISKIGINPSSIYYTPVGIYCYPLSDYSASFEKLNKILVPFVGDAPYINVLIMKKGQRVLNFDSYDETDYSDDIAALRDYYIKVYNDERMFELIVADAAEHGTDWGKNIWNVTRKLSKDIAANTKRRNRTSTNNKAHPSSVLWNYLLRVVLRYDLVYDSGKSIIHENEPNQAVFLKKDSFNLVEVIDNKESNAGLLARIKKDKYEVSKLDKKAVHQYVLDNYKNTTSLYFPTGYFEFPSDIILNLIKSDPFWLTNIKSVTDGKLDEIENYLLSDIGTDIKTYDWGDDHNANIKYISMFYFIEKLKNKRIKHYEDMLLSDGKPNLIYQYINRILKNAWPEAENKLKSDRDIYNRYLSTYRPDELNNIAAKQRKVSVGSVFTLQNGIVVTVVKNTNLDRIVIRTDDGRRGTISYDKLVG
jgi:hypothetical protein